MPETPLYTQMSNLLFYANNLTGEADEHLGDAVYKLGLGYGQGGGDYACFVKDIVYTGTAQSGSVELASRQELTGAGILYAKDGKIRTLSALWERTYIQLQKNDDYHEARVILKSESFYPPAYYNGSNAYHGQMFVHSSSATSGTSAVTTTPILSNYDPGVYGYPFLSISQNIVLAPNTTFKFARNYRLTVTCFGKLL